MIDLLDRVIYVVGPCFLAPFFQHWSITDFQVHSINLLSPKRQVEKPLGGIKLHIQGGAKVGVQLYLKQFTLILLFINSCIIFHMKNCKPPFPQPSIWP